MAQTQPQMEMETKASTIQDFRFDLNSEVKRPPFSFSDNRIRDEVRRARKRWHKKEKFREVLSLGVKLTKAACY
jgi:hypothetical protein